MEKTFLFQGEEVIMTTEDNSIVLTNRRIRQNEMLNENSHFISIFLNNISTIEVYSRTRGILIVFGLALIIGGPIIATSENNVGILIGSLTGAILLFILYFLIRSHLVIISSDGGVKMSFKVAKRKRKEVLDIVNKIETAKNFVK